MTRTATKRKPKHKPVVSKVKPPKKTSDQAIYGGIVIIGFFAVMIAALFTQQLSYWGVFAVGYLAIIAYLIHLNTWHVYRGRHLATWQQALARIPLRFAGYGTKEGKPLEAAHGHSETLRALTVSLIVSVVILAGLAFAAWRWTL